jgi:hypothetical protein
MVVERIKRQAVMVERMKGQAVMVERIKRQEVVVAVLWIRNFSLQIWIRIRLFNKFRIRIGIKLSKNQYPVSDPTF